VFVSYLNTRASRCKYLTPFLIYARFYAKVA